MEELSEFSLLIMQEVFSNDQDRDDLVVRTKEKLPLKDLRGKNLARVVVDPDSERKLILESIEESLD